MNPRPLSRLVVGAATAAALALMAVPAQSQVAQSQVAQSQVAQSQVAQSAIAGPADAVLQPALRAHLDDVGAGAAVRVMVQAGGSIAAAEAATRAAGLAPRPAWTGSALPWGSGPRLRWGRWRPRRA